MKSQVIKLIVGGLAAVIAAPVIPDESEITIRNSQFGFTKRIRDALLLVPYCFLRATEFNRYIAITSIGGVNATQRWK